MSLEHAMTKATLKHFSLFFFKPPAHPSRIQKVQDLDLCLGAKKNVSYQK